MCHTLVDTQFIDKRTTQGEVNIFSVFLDGYNGSKLFYDALKHGCFEI